MKLRVSQHSFHHDDSPQIKAVDESSPALVGIGVGSLVLVVALAAVSCACYRRRGAAQAKGPSQRRHPDKNLPLKKSSAVRSPSSGPAGPILKKSPSPTGGSKSPLGGNRSPSSQGGLTPPTETARSICESATKEVRAVVPAAAAASTTSAAVVASTARAHADGDKKDVSPPAAEDVADTKEKEVTEEKPTQLGQLHFRLRYNSEKHALLVTIVRCSDLPARDPNTGSSDPYVKLQLLPEKQHKVKTRVLRRTLSPVYDEDFTFYGINPNQLQATTLHFVVLSFDRYSRDDVIGEVVCSMAGLDTDHLDKTLALSRDIAPRHFKIRSQGRGELLVSLCHQPAANRLTVVVLKARNLPKIYLLYNEQRIAKKKTHIKKRTVNPVFNESFVFEVPYNEGLDNLSLEFLVLDWDRVTKNEVVGRLQLGPRGSPAAQQHWREVRNSPRRQIAEWHKLRE
ncbi:hypothetical protein HPB52_020094 [Rhipicephalus sanguineus]|uniref:C2 domain-containing protein n=1 Tax=Rhipicephalus sanguineus TaxID=34632 RepID=A0A9D4Q2A7_RHISA|nr:hypothetical protein HPB52_020094 [Rhipicephalus sanguineus]